MKRPRERGAEDPAPSLALGYLALVPLIVAHEWGAGADHRVLVNFAAVLLALPLAPLGRAALEASWVIYAALAIASLVRLYRADYALAPRLLRILGEGLGFAIALGPLLVFLCWLLGLAGSATTLRAGAPAHVPSLALAGVVCGGAAFEEIVFRLGVLSIAYLALRRLLLLARAPTSVADRSAGALAVGVSAVVFALSHLDAVVRPLFGPGGEPFDAAIFTWRVLAGILLGILFRWRGMGVAAWAHALFNLALSIGAGPDVFL
ncbi:MAG: CPBP family intramembrane metalloprotease [Planctomycetes bacterium]|nr:CPBP family intramembrane metalloprotease [Planctomycetota bacterium]